MDSWKGSGTYVQPLTLQMRTWGLRVPGACPRLQSCGGRVKTGTPISHLVLRFGVGSYAQGRPCTNSFLGKTQPWRPGRVQSMRAWLLGIHPHVLPTGAAARAAEEGESSW